MTGPARAIAGTMRRIADRIDHAGAPKIMHWSFTFETGKGIVFREDGRGCRLAYLGDAEYERAHAEADCATDPVNILLAILAAAPPEGIIPAHLAEITGMSRPHVYALLDRLKQDGRAVSLRRGHWRAAP